MARLTEIYNCWQCEDCLFSETLQLCTKMEDRPVYDQAFGIPDWCPLPEASGWIPVGERLPEEGREVLVLSRIRRIAGGGANPAVFSAHFYDGDWELPDQRGWLMGKLVTHWRRLPSLPEEATSD